MSETTPIHSVRKLMRARAIDVLGEYEHSLEFKAPGDFAIIFGPNGIGKTKFLEIIDSLSNLRVDLLAALPFGAAVLEFSDGSELSVTRDSVVPTDENGLFDSESFLLDSYRNTRAHRLADLENRPVSALHFSLTDKDGEVHTSAHISTDLVGRFSHPGAIRTEYERLLRSGVSSHEARAFVRQAENARPGSATLPPVIEAFCESLDVRLIETQRLITYDAETRSPAGRREPGTSRPTIEEHSKTVRTQLEDDLTQNSRLAQRLDSTFPRRMLVAGESSRMTEEEIRRQLAEQNRRRARITQITPLGLDPDLPLPKGKLSKSQISVLELYLQDAESKLESFSSTVKKIDLLESIVNTRLLGKRLRISAGNGLEITRDIDDENVPLTWLSSGEQHEIILMFDLLFNVRAGGLVLIDEPEISLHIAWQQQFISDVLDIARLVGFQFVIATHSPQIIDNFWRFAERLGPTTVAFDRADSSTINA